MVIQTVGAAAPSNGNQDTLPTHEDLTGPCPNCGRTSNFELTGVSWQVGVDHFAFHLTCRGCMRSCIVIEKRHGDNAQCIYEPAHWWPVPGAGHLDPAVNAKVADAYDEGARCLAVRAPRAAAVMFRAMLAFVVADKGSASARSKTGLAGKLKQMAADGDLHPSLASWAEAVRVLGNSGAHPDELPEPTQAEAEELERLCRRMIEFLYEIDARI